jgi:hypothetical protein
VAAAAVAALIVVRVAHAPGTHELASAPASRGLHPAAPAPTALPSPAAINDPGLDPNSLPAVAPSAPTTATPPPPRGATGATTPSREAPAAEPTAHVTEADLAAVAPSDPGDLGNAMRSAVGPRTDDTAAKESVANAGARQLRPSPGAVLGAINSVLPSARACLGPDDAVRTGSLVFRSDGSVASVDLRSARSEDACVKTALSKARVGAFADDTFVARVTVRP